MTYQEQLDTKEWKDKRVEILIRDNFTCQHPDCGSKIRLEVHHVDYLDDLKVWEYPSDMLLTLCHKHHSVEQNRKKSEIYLINTLKMKGFLLSDLLAFSCKLETNDQFVKTLLKVLRNG